MSNVLGKSDRFSCKKRKIFCKNRQIFFKKSPNFHEKSSNVPLKTVRFFYKNRQIFLQKLESFPENFSNFSTKIVTFAHLCIHLNGIMFPLKNLLSTFSLDGKSRIQWQNLMHLAPSPGFNSWHTLNLQTLDTSHRSVGRRVWNTNNFCEWMQWDGGFGRQSSPYTPPLSLLNI